MTVEVLVGEVNERSTCYLTVNFLDKDGNAAAPATASYWIRCATTGTRILSETPIATPSSSEEITITPAQNAILDATNEYEVKEVTVKATFAGSQESYGSAKFKVKNLADLPFV